MQLRSLFPSALILCLALLSCASPASGEALRREFGTEEPTSQGAQRQAAPETNASPSHRINSKKLQLHSQYALLIRLDTGERLLDMGGRERIYPASLTKIMTTLIAIEETEDRNRMIPLHESYFVDVQAGLSTTAGFLPGEWVRVEDLLYGAMLPSGAECCLGLADLVSGSEEAFVDMMNSKALELGMEGTRFSNVRGQQDPGHYTTLEDLSLLLACALDNPAFRRIFTAEEHAVWEASLHPRGHLLSSTVFSRMESPEFQGGRILGGKTGHTADAGQCLATLAEKDGVPYLLLTAAAFPQDPAGQALHIEDAFTVYNGLYLHRK